MTPLHQIADTLQARALARDALAPTEMHAMACAIRSQADELKRALEQLDGLVEASAVRAMTGRVVRLSPALAVIGGGRHA